MLIECSGARLQVLVEVLAGLRLADADAPYGGFVVKLNHRRLLDAMLAVAGVPPHKFRCHISVTQNCREASLLPVLQTGQGIRHRQSHAICPRHMHHLSARIRIPLDLGKRCALLHRDHAAPPSRSWTKWIGCKPSSAIFGLSLHVGLQILTIRILPKPRTSALLLTSRIAGLNRDAAGVVEHGLSDGHASSLVRSLVRQ